MLGFPPPFAQNLQWAYEGFAGSGRFETAGQLLRDKFGSELRGMMPIPGSEQFTACKSLQKQVHKVLMGCAFKDIEGAQINVLARDRISKLFAPFHIDFCSEVDVDGAFNLLNHLQPQNALKVIKTWLNGWATSARMHEDILLPCLLGCGTGEDSLKHYLQCPQLYAFCRCFFNTDSCPLIRIGIKNPTISNLKIVSCVYTAYRAAKAQVRECRILMQENAGTTRATWSVFADALEADAGEYRIPYVAFSLPKFTSFFN